MFTYIYITTLPTHILEILPENGSDARLLYNAKQNSENYAFIPLQCSRKIHPQSHLHKSRSPPHENNIMLE